MGYNLKEYLNSTEMFINIFNFNGTLPDVFVQEKKLTNKLLAQWFDSHR